MANLRAINLFGESLMSHLTSSYDFFTSSGPQGEWPSFNFQLLSSHSFEDTNNLKNLVSCFLYRVTINEHLRNKNQINGSSYKHAPLALDLHYLITVWAEETQLEHNLLAWTMRQLHLNPIFDNSFLDSEAQWKSGEVIHILPEELSNEDMMRIWDTLKPSYRLSVSYVARVVRIEPDQTLDELPRVVATRYSWKDSPEDVQRNREEATP